MNREEIESAYPLKSTVLVRLAYQGNGKYAPDGFDGQWFVVGYVGSPVHGYADLKIARHPEDDWQGIVHLCRVRGSREGARHEAEENRWREAHGFARLDASR